VISGRITVTDGEVTGWQSYPMSDATPDAAASTVGTPPVDLPTVDDMISSAAAAEGTATGKVSITYDPATGIPTDAAIDWMRVAVDDETGWVVSDFEILAGPQP
jgi:hypothetical protein